ncbi:MAG: hypothetical protein K9K88_15170 [Desulfobacterales bacterium]|nr:hypothetical protein [Desulfobacterales bacterium]
MKPKWIRTLALVCMIAAGLAACSTTPEPFEYQDVREEKPGPGLFTGEQGGVVMLLSCR